MIRAARLEDCGAMGNLVVRAWQAGYRGIMSDDYLDGLRPEDRAAMWRQNLEHLRPDRRIVVAETDGSVVGFAAGGPEYGDDARPAVGELYALNVDPAHWGRGAGRALLEAVTDHLRAAGDRAAVLWVVEQNDRARRFYEASGWLADGTAREDEVFGARVQEVRYRRPL